MEKFEYVVDFYDGESQIIEVQADSEEEALKIARSEAIELWKEREE